MNRHTPNSRDDSSRPEECPRNYSKETTDQTVTSEKVERPVLPSTNYIPLPSICRGGRFEDEGLDSKAPPVPHFLQDDLKAAVVASEDNFHDDVCYHHNDLVDHKNMRPSLRRKSSVRSSFALRQVSRGEGLYWSDLKLDLLKGDAVVKHILKGAWGEALPFETTAIMGASGAGKTSLFNALSGRTGPKLALEGEIRFGKTVVDETNLGIYQKKLAFVAQEDVLSETSTPRETIRFSARLRLPRKTRNEDIDELVAEYLTKLGLDKCADTEIGGTVKKGISGGEKKRTSVGIELVTDPSIILLDEPTSGLDSFAAKNLMQLLETIAKAGNTVLFTIHQPSSRIFFSFDKLILLNDGQLMHTGMALDMVSEFDIRGYPAEANFNPADWALEVAQDNSVDQLKENGFFPEDTRVLPEPMSNPLEEVAGGASIFTQTKLLTQREWTSFRRLPLPLIMGLFIAIMLGLFGGILFWGIFDESQQDPSVIGAQTGAMVTVMLMSMMNQSTIVLLAFALERPLFLKEYLTKHYTVIPYVMSKFFAELCNTIVILLVQSIIFYFMMSFQMRFIVFYVLNILASLNATAAASLVGSTVSDPALASSLFPLVIIPQFYFSGVLVAIPLIPTWIRWCQYILALRWVVALALVYEYEECSPEDQSACEAALQANDMDPDDRWWYWVLLVGLFAVFKIGSIVLLQLNVPK